MKKGIMAFILLIAMIITQPAYGGEKKVTVTIPSFPVVFNDINYISDNFDMYPLLVYEGITYFPMTYSCSNLLNLNTSWTDSGGLVIAKADPDVPKDVQGIGREGWLKNVNKKMQTAAIVASKVTVNGKVVDNAKEAYPLLHFRDVTYFPLTWRFAVEEFGWNYDFDNKAGLNIAADNFFFHTLNFTEYSKGGLKVKIRLESNRAMPIGKDNLSMIKNGKEIRPEGYFGYSLLDGDQKAGPLFTVSGGFVYTTQLSETDFITPIPCRVNIDTGDVYSQSGDEKTNE